MKKAVVVLAVLLLVAASKELWGQVQYSVTDLGSIWEPPMPLFWGLGINNNGQIVETPAVTNHATLYSNGTLQDLGTLGGGTLSEANAINDSGQVTGIYVNGSGASRAFLYSGGTTQDIGDLGGTATEAFGINNKGQIVGWSDLGNASTPFHAFAYSNGTMQDLDTLPGDINSIAIGINNSGQIVGESISGFGREAFLYSGGSMQNLGSLGGAYSGANGINDNGQIVGASDNAANSSRAFLYSNGSMQDLNTLIPTNSGWMLEDAIAINNSGQIVGYGENSNGDDAFLLTPTPEPSTLALLGVGTIGLIGYAWRKRRWKRSLSIAGKSTLSSENDCPSIVSFPSQWTEARRRAA